MTLRLCKAKHLKNLILFKLKIKKNLIDVMLKSIDECSKGSLTDRERFHNVINLENVIKLEKTQIIFCSLLSKSFIHYSFWTMCWIRLETIRKFSKFIHYFPFLMKICLFSFLSNKMFNFLKVPNFNGTGPTILDLVSAQAHLAPAAAAC